MRWFCTGRVVEWDQPEFDDLLKKMHKVKIDGARAIVMLRVFKGVFVPKTRESRLRLIVPSTNILRLRRTSHQIEHRSRKDQGRAKSVYGRSRDIGAFRKEDDREGSYGALSAVRECEEFGWMWRAESSQTRDRGVCFAARWFDLAEKGHEAMGGDDDGVRGGARGRGFAESFR